MTIAQSDAEKQKIIKELTSQGYDLAGDNLPVLKNAIDIISHTDSAISITEVAGLISQRSLTASIGSTASFLSALLIPVGSMIAIVDAMEASKRTYGMRAIAYTITAWAFDDEIPTQSKRIMHNYTHGFPVKSDDEVAALHKAWKKARDRALRSVRNTASEKGVSEEALKIVYRALGENDRRTLCLKIMKGFESKISNRTSRKVWVSNYKILYPR